MNIIALLLLTGLVFAAEPKTNVTIVGEDFQINGKPTYACRVWK